MTLPFNVPPLSRFASVTGFDQSNAAQIGTLEVLGNLQPTEYTPAWTASSDPSIGNGAISGRFFQVGAMTWCWIEITMGSTTTFGSGIWSLSLPTIAVINPDPVFTVQCRDNSPAQEYSGSGRLTATTITAMAVQTAAADGRLQSSHPFTWTTSDVLWVSGFYLTATL